MFRVVYPGGYQAFDDTYISDHDGSNEQFREFEFSDHVMIPTKVWALGNRNADGSWPNPMVLDTDYQVWDINADWSIDEASNYTEIKQFHLAETLDATSDDLKNRAEAIALHQIMEESLGKLIAQHHCGVELYDYIEVKDIRGAATYTIYPTDFRSGRWDNKMIVGSLIHVYDPERGKYDIEITFNGISSEPPDFRTVPKTQEEIEDLIPEPQPLPYVAPVILPGGTEFVPVDGGGGGGRDGGLGQVPFPGARQAGRAGGRIQQFQTQPTAQAVSVAQAARAAAQRAWQVSPQGAPVPAGVPIPGPTGVGARGLARERVREPVRVPTGLTFPAPAFGTPQYQAQQLAKAESDLPPAFVGEAFRAGAIGVAALGIGVAVLAVAPAAIPSIPRLLPLVPRLAPAVVRGLPTFGARRF